jgi:hypothetical protein
VIACLELLNEASQGLAPSAKPDASASELPEPKSAALRFARGRVILFVALSALPAIAVGLNWHSSSVRLPAARNMEQQPFGKRSGDDVSASWEAERKKNLARFTDADLQRMVDRLFVQDDPGRANFHGLLYADSRQLPFLLKALDDPRTSTVVFEKNGFDPLEMFPFGRICGLSDELAPVEAAKPLARYLDHPNPMFRRQAASLLASLSCAECLEPVKKALTDEDHGVREFTLGGLNRGLAQRQPDVGFLSGVFPVLTRRDIFPCAIHSYGRFLGPWTMKTLRFRARLFSRCWQNWNRSPVTPVKSPFMRRRWFFMPTMRMIDPRAGSGV